MTVPAGAPEFRSGSLIITVGGDHLPSQEDLQHLADLFSEIVAEPTDRPSAIVLAGGYDYRISCERGEDGVARWAGRRLEVRFLPGTDPVEDPVLLTRKEQCVLGSLLSSWEDDGPFRKFRLSPVEKEDLLSKLLRMRLYANADPSTLSSMRK